MEVEAPREERPVGRIGRAERKRSAQRGQESRSEGRESAKEGVVGELLHCTRGRLPSTEEMAHLLCASPPALNTLHPLETASGAGSLTGPMVLLGTAWPQLRELHHGQSKDGQLTRSRPQTTSELKSQNHADTKAQNSSIFPPC